jgi:hypothetical protein
MDVGAEIIMDTEIELSAEPAGFEYEYEYEYDDYDYYYESNRRVNNWLHHHMDNAPFHKICYDSFVTAKQISDYLTENGNDSALAVDPRHGMTPLHILSMNPRAPADTIVALFNSNMEAAFRQDAQEKTPLDYAREYNVDGLVSMIAGLCNHRNSMS